MRTGDFSFFTNGAELKARSDAIEQKTMGDRYELLEKAFQKVSNLTGLAEKAGGSPIAAMKSQLKAIFSHDLKIAAFIANTMHKAIDADTCALSLKPRDYVLRPELHSGAAGMMKSSKFACFLVMATAAQKNCAQDVIKST